MAEVYKFYSGLTLLYEKNTINKITNLEIRFECGSKCDGDLPGLAHFCEHMFFTGTDKLTRQEIRERYYEFPNTGASTNARRIRFYGEIFTNELEDYLNLVQKMICDSTFSPEEVKEQQSVIRQEMAMYEGDHENGNKIFMGYELYGLDYLKYDVLGTEETINKITSDDVKKFVQKYFVNNNCIITICSPLDFEEIKSIIKTNFESLMPNNDLFLDIDYRDKLLDCEKLSMHYESVDKNFFNLVFKFDREFTTYRDRMLIYFMKEVLSEELDWNLRTDKSLVYYISVGYNTSWINGDIEIQTQISKDKIKLCLDELIDCINTIYKTGFSEDSFYKSMSYNKYLYDSQVKTPESIKEDINWDYLYYGKFLTDDEKYDIENSITLDELNQAMREWFNKSKIQLIIYGDAGKEDVYTIDEIKQKLTLDNV